MNKQEEIREDVARTFYEHSDFAPLVSWLMLPDEARESFFYRADNLLHRLKKNGVVIKVDDAESPFGFSLEPLVEVRK